MSTYLPIGEAANMALMSEQCLNSVLKKRKIRVAQISTGGTLVNMEDLRKLKKQDWPEYQAVMHLAGQRIWISQAARDYNIAQQTISRWVDRGYIKQYAHQGNKRMIDQADIAFCAKLYKLNPGHGNRKFSQIMDQLINE